MSQYYYSSGNVKKIVIIAMAVIVFGAIFFLSRLSDDISPKQLSPEEIIARQIEELDKLRKETPPLTPEQLNQQTEELDKLRKETPPLTPEQIDKQIEELNKIKN